MTKDVWLKRIALVVLMTIVTAISSATWAEENDSAVKAPSLRNIMQELSNNMQIVTDAISREDWEQVAGTASQIAEKMRILGFAGSNVSKFKSFDEQTHQAAKELEEIAMRKDGKGVIAQFATLQKSCLACHQSFRKTFKEHFYGK